MFTIFLRILINLNYIAETSEALYGKQSVSESAQVIFVRILNGTSFESNLVLGDRCWSRANEFLQAAGNSVQSAHVEIVLPKTNAQPCYEMYLLVRLALCRKPPRSE